MSAKVCDWCGCGKERHPVMAYMASAPFVVCGKYRPDRLERLHPLARRLRGLLWRGGE